MAWTFDLPSCLKIDAMFGDFYPSNLEVAYDGKNLWYVNEQRNGLVILDFWGPYNDINNGLYIRHLAQEDDEIRVGSRGPDVNVLAYVQFQTQSAIQSITYMNDSVYVLHEQNGGEIQISRVFTDLRQVGTSTKFAPRTVSNDGLVPIITVPVFCRVACSPLNEPVKSDIAGVNGRIFFVDGTPTTQELEDGQELCSIQVSSVSGSAPLVSPTRTTVPGRKQRVKRNMAVANDSLYITAFNELNIYKFGSDGSSLSTITVNRDVQNIFTVDNELWVISSNKSELIFGTGEDAKDVSAYMISKINAADVMTHVVGFPSPGTAVLENMHFGHDGSNLWIMGLDGNFAKIKTSNLTAFLSDKNVAEGDDFNFEAMQTVYIGGLSNGSYVDTVDISSDLINLWVSPQQTYQWYDGDTFVTVNVPRHLFLFKKGESIMMQRLPGALKYHSEFKTNQYVALSSGPRRYKAD